MDEAFALLRDVVSEINGRGDQALLTALKPELLKRQPSFNGAGVRLRRLSCSSAVAAQTRGYLKLRWDDELQDYTLAASTRGQRRS